MLNVNRKTSIYLYRPWRSNWICGNRLGRFRGFRSTIRLSGWIFIFYRFFCWCHMCVNALKVQGPSVWQGNAIKDLEKKIFFPENNKFTQTPVKGTREALDSRTAKMCGWWLWPNRTATRPNELACIMHSVCPPTFEMLWEICRTPKSISQQ